MQRLGRAGRDPSLETMGLLLAEPRFFDDEKEKKAAQAETRALRAANRAAKTNASKNVKVGQKRKRKEAPEIEPELDTLINAKTASNTTPKACRRDVCNKYFENNTCE